MRAISSLMSLQGRVALITGGAGHIGRAMAGTFVELGARVVLLDRHQAEVDAAAQSLTEEYGTSVDSLCVNLMDEPSLREVPQRVVNVSGRLDILINNAAFVGTDELKGWAVPVEDQSMLTWRQALEVNLTAPFLLTQKSIPFLKASGNGVVINIGSIYGALGPDWSLYSNTTIAGTPAAYGVSKGGLLQMTRWLATTLAPDIRVNAIVPGGIERGARDDFVERYEARTPMNRMAKEEDMKGVAAFLASDMSAYITGQCIAVDGGWSAW